ncbi:MAG: restriction endonuclease subunit S [Succiniclasticum sp.]|uniref:restriction endonuclease subunit S n=1 Tax=Succiniclasticum sp. TaxID=2775030 RepID=UPI002A90AC0B|nr:restriction endonuclease subunit S [Succiniclasticum sp.]MDY6289977.1 restriction endonuclease subunit S [Succiniclasticum sp.]
MSRLDKLIAELCPNGVEYKPLEQCCSILDNRRKPVTKAARVSGEYPYYGANGIQDYVSEYIFEGVFILVGEDGSVMTPNGNPVVNWAEGKIWVNNHAHIVEEKEGILLRYLYHFIQTVNVSDVIHGNIPKLTGKDFRAIRVPVPPLEVQREIARVLDNFTLLTAELTAELTARKKQYEYYKDKLLSFDADITTIPLANIAEIGTGSSNTNEAVKDGKYPFFVRSQIPLLKNEYEYDETAIITAGDGVGVGKVFHYVEGKYALHQRAYRIHIVDKRVLSKYAFYYIQAKFYDYISKAGFHSSVSSIRRPMLNAFEIPLPAIGLQKEIIKALDNFDKVCNDISIGLPAEIAARQKQYEYYRDKLLTFKEAR